MLQICSDSVFINEHVQRRIEEELDGRLGLAWVVAGSQRHNSRSGRVNRGEGRALIGFLDGTSNLDPRNSPDDARLVFVDPAAVADYPPRVPSFDPGQPSPYGPQPPSFPSDLRNPPTREPDWTKGGTYLVARASVMDTSAWDDRPLGEQERVVGRFKASGSALDKPDDPRSRLPSPTSPRIQTVRPRRSRRTSARATPVVLTTRSGASFGAATRSCSRTSRARCGGLVFVAFARTITTQFEFITRGWTTNPDFPRPGTGIDALRQFERVLCGGYFFAPPLARANQPWSWVVPAASQS
jgi:Dyp-type peroxidase family